jgi:hypothetical protein
MSWLDPFDIAGKAGSFLNPQKGYEKGQEQLDKYYQQGQGYLNPYNQYGQDAYGNLSEAMKRFLDPAGLQAEWTKGYSESPSAKNAEAMAQEHGLDAASGLGLMGSNTALNAIQGGTTQIGLDDRQNYLNDLMQKYLAGAGIAGNIFNTGANAAGAMSNNAMQMGGNSAQMAYGKQNSPGDLFGKLLGMGVGAMTGGAGGAAGAAAGAGGGGGGWSFGGR